VSGTDQYHAALLREEANAGRAINPNKRLGAAVAASSTSDTPATAPPLASATYRTVIEPRKQEESAAHDRYESCTRWRGSGYT
jgi:hypothetical protein